MEQEFHALVRKSWHGATFCKHDIYKWQENARRLRRNLKGWHINLEGVYMNQKKQAPAKLDKLDKKSEDYLLSLEERECKMVLDTMLKLLRDEETKWRQRAKEKYMKEGQGNTRYFHLKVSGREKKNFISGLKKDEIEIVGNAELIQHITDFYKDLFGESEISNIRLEGIECNKVDEDDRPR